MSLTYTIKGTNGEAASRDHMVTYLNTGTGAAPTWSAMGRTVEESSIEYDYSQETKTDILGETRMTAKEPVLTQSFSGSQLLAGDAVLNHILDLTVVRRNISEALNQDVMVVHQYLTDSDGNPFAERWKSSAVLLTTNGGAGGDMLASDIEVTFGGERETGTISKDGTGKIEFTANT